MSAPTKKHNRARLPAPLVPRGVDLTSYKWFKLHYKRLRHSEFWKRSTDQVCRISVDFWCEAYCQIPAGSLPDDDHNLAEWAGFGRGELQRWLDVKDLVMSAWTKCSDGRWYHPTLVEVVLDAWGSRLQDAWKKECDRVRKANLQRAKEGKEPLPMPPAPAAFSSDGKNKIPSGKVGRSSGIPPELQGIPAENALREEIEIEIEKPLSKILTLKEREICFTRFTGLYPSAGLRLLDAVERGLNARLDEGVSIEDILAGAAAYADFCRREGRTGRYVKAAQAWLDGGGWKETQPPEVAAAVANKTFVAKEDPRWPALADRYSAGHHNKSRPPSEKGWYFSNEWIASLDTP